MMSNPARPLSNRWSLLPIGLILVLALAVGVMPLQAGGAVKKPVTKALVMVNDGAHLNVRRYPTGYAEVIYQLDAKAEVTVKGIAVTDLTVTTPVPPTPEGGSSTTTTTTTTTTTQTVQTGGYTVINNSAACGGNSCIILPGFDTTPQPPQSSSSGKVTSSTITVDNNTCSVTGWAVDGTNPTAVIQILIDGQPAGNFLTVLNAPEAIAQTNVGGTHGFGADLGLLRPAILDGKGHLVAAVLLGANGQQTALGAAQTITCPTGGSLNVDRLWVYIDYVPSGAGADNTNCGEVTGWVSARYLKFYSSVDIAGTTTPDDVKGWNLTTVLTKVVRTDITVSGKITNLTAYKVSDSDTTIYTPNATVYICNMDAGANLKVHSQPNLISDTLGKVQLGAQGTVRGRTADFKWVYVDMTGFTGYVPANYLCVQPQSALCAVSPTQGAPAPVTTPVAPVGGNALDAGTPIPAVSPVAPVQPTATEAGAPNAVATVAAPVGS